MQSSEQTTSFPPKGSQTTVVVALITLKNKYMYPRTFITVILSSLTITRPSSFARGMLILQRTVIKIVITRWLKHRLLFFYDGYCYVAEYCCMQISLYGAFLRKSIFGDFHIYAVRVSSAPWDFHARCIRRRLSESASRKYMNLALLWA